MSAYRFYRRDIPTTIILTLATCGLYGIFWTYMLGRETHQVDENLPDGGMLLLFSILTCGVYSLYWTYVVGNSIGAIKVQVIPGAKSEQNGVLYLLLSALGLGIVAYALIQKDLNDMSDAIVQGCLDPSQWS